MIGDSGGETKNIKREEEKLKQEKRDIYRQRESFDSVVRKSTELVKIYMIWK